MKKKELNLQTRYVLWLFGEIIHQIRGWGPYGDLGPPYDHRGGSKIAKKGIKKAYKREEMKKNEPNLQTRSGFSVCWRSNT